MKNGCVAYTYVKTLLLFADMPVFIRPGQELNTGCVVALLDRLLGLYLCNCLENTKR